MDEQKDTQTIKLNDFSVALLDAFGEKEQSESAKNGMKVNPLISEVAAWYEKVRNAMEYREEEVILRAAIERIMRRRLILGGNGKIVAEPLIRELIWARYFPDESIPESVIANVASTIDRYLNLRTQVVRLHKIKDKDLNDWTYHLMSSDVARTLSLNNKKEIMTNYLFYMFKNNVSIEGVSEEVRDAQVYIALRRAFAKDDKAFLRFYLFNQYFSELTDENLENVASRFLEGFTEIELELKHPIGRKILRYIKRQLPPFLILEDILLEERQELRKVFANRDLLREKIVIKCKKKYSRIRSKVNRAIVRSVIFILISKAILALVVEGTYDNLFYGRIIWGSLILNIAIPPILIIIASLFVKKPGNDNSVKIVQRIESLLFDEKPVFAVPAVFSTEKKRTGIIDVVFDLLWVVATIASFGLVVYILSILRFNIISQVIFIFFLTIISFLIYRIYQISHTYTISDKQSFMTPIVDFLFLPIAQVGRYLTEGFAQVNVFLFVLDFIIETPFKGLFAFFEQWFFFLHTKREYLD